MKKDPSRKAATALHSLGKGRAGRVQAETGKTNQQNEKRKKGSNLERDPGTSRNEKDTRLVNGGQIFGTVELGGAETRHDTDTHSQMKKLGTYDQSVEEGGDTTEKLFGWKGRSQWQRSQNLVLNTLAHPKKHSGLRTSQRGTGAPTIK